MITKITSGNQKGMGYNFKSANQERKDYCTPPTLFSSPKSDMGESIKS